MEQAKSSPLLRLIGTPEELAAKAQAGVDAGSYDRRDMEHVVARVLSWARNWYGE